MRAPFPASLAKFGSASPRKADTSSYIKQEEAALALALAVMMAALVCCTRLRSRYAREWFGSHINERNSCVTNHV
jgi:hypothetical protein